MPEVSRFYGIAILFYCNDHAPPHFRATYAGERAVFDIQTLEMSADSLPRRAQGLVREWAAEHQKELLLAWESARHSLPPGKIAPLP